MEKHNVSQKEAIKKLENGIIEKEGLYQNSIEIIDKLRQDLTEAREKVEFLSSEIRVSNFVNIILCLINDLIILDKLFSNSAES